MEEALDAEMKAMQEEMQRIQEEMAKQLQAEMGFYYSEKLYGAAEIGLYNATKDKTHQEASVAHLEKALEYWKTYAQDFAARYRPQMMARLQLVTDPGEYTSEAERDISIAQKWRIR